jgi:hypothetical protein
MDRTGRTCSKTIITEPVKPEDAYLNGPGALFHRIKILLEQGIQTFSVRMQQLHTSYGSQDFSLSYGVSPDFACDKTTQEQADGGMLYEH